MPTADNLIRLTCQPKTGCERFRADDKDLDFALSDFWRWSMSDLVSNATRGRLAGIHRCQGSVDLDRHPQR